MGIVAGLFAYLVNAGYLAGNPWTLRRRKRVSNLRQVERYLDQAQWTAVLDFIETLPRESWRDCQHYERIRWVVRFLYDTALRVAEAAQARSSDFVRRRGKWWLRVLGKGGVYGEVPIRDELMADFARYRTFHGLPATPSPFETTPVILSITGRAQTCLTPTAIYLVVKDVFGQAADTLAACDPVTATVLRRASTHWLRHTAASHQADSGIDLRHIQKNLRHASIETTAIYLHTADDARHRDTTAEQRPDPTFLSTPNPTALRPLNRTQATIPTHVHRVFDVTTLRARALRGLKYYNPRHVLVELRKTELALASRTDVPDAVKHLRTQQLKPLRELREACLFCYGWSQIDGQSFDVAHVEGQDYDAVASWRSDTHHHFAPLQIKEVVPEHMNSHTSVQDIVNKLTKYTNSEDLTVVIHLNRTVPFSPANLVVPPLKIAALWVFGALNAEQTRWMIWGNFLETPREGEFFYPE
jgi:integrase